MSRPTREEWEKLEVQIGEAPGLKDADRIPVVRVEGPKLKIHHAATPDTPVVEFEGEARWILAKLALHGESFGFTWHDVDYLQDTASMQKSTFVTKELRALADRIAALLSPREDYPLDRGDA